MGYKQDQMLLLLNKHGDPSFFFQNLISHMYNINNKQAKFDNNLSVALVLFQWNDLKFVISHWSVSIRLLLVKLVGLRSVYC